MSRTPELLPAELFEQIKRIQLRTQRLVTDALAGQYESAFKGRGMEFEQVREYLPGDDIRHLDWNVSARTGRLHLKQHREERELTVMLIVDVSSSGTFGTHQKRKCEVAAEVAAVLAYTAIKTNDRVGLILFSDHVERYIPPKKGRAHVWRVIREILTFRVGERRGTSIDRALELLGHVTKRRVVGFLISDFIDQGYEHRLRVAARRHDLTAVMIRDPREEELPDLGLLELEDAESGESIVVDTAARVARERFAATVAQAHARRRELFRQAGLGTIEVATDRSWVEALVLFFRRRERRRRRAA